jgi:hypothetical protein
VKSTSSLRISKKNSPFATFLRIKKILKPGFVSSHSVPIPGSDRNEHFRADQEAVRFLSAALYPGCAELGLYPRYESALAGRALSVDTPQTLD